MIRKIHCLYCNVQVETNYIRQKICNKKYCKKLLAKQFSNNYYHNNKELCTLSTKNWLSKNLVSYINYQKKWRVDNRLKLNKLMRIHKKKHKLKINARNFIFRDKLKNPEKYSKICSVCGSNKNIEQHHKDYNKPFDVISLCKLHHTKIHLEVSM